MSKDPAFLFYSDNFQSGTQFFTHAQVGIYIRLLCAQHLHGHLSEKQVLLICGTSDKDTDEVLQKFTTDETGKYYNKRLDIEVEKRRLFSESRANNRLGKTKKQVNKTRKTSVKHLEDGNGNEIKYKEVFEKFRVKFPGVKKGLETEFKNFTTKHKDWKDVLPTLELKLDGQIAWRKNATGFVPEWQHLQTWINQRSWETEMENNQNGKAIVSALDPRRKYNAFGD